MGLRSSVRKKRTDRKVEKKIRKGEEKAVKYLAKAKRKAETAADRKLRKQELRTEHKFHKRGQKAERKTVKAAAKAQKKVAEAEAKTVAEQAKAESAKAMFTPAKMKRYLAVGRMAAPVVVPLAYRGAVAARAQITEIQARRAGVPANVLTQYGGPSAALRARIATSRDSAAKVAGAEQTAEGKSFVEAMSARLTNLEVAADAADAMPPAQRKSAHRAIENELTAIDNDLLARLNVHPA